ncbi:MAG: tetratricopeptide repeat protein, partial [Terriglobales bacterium]
MGKPSLLIRSLSFSLVILLLASPGWATCGGGGGGGTGGLRGGAAAGVSAPTYRVPWKVVQPNDKPASEGLVVYWFPSSQAELQASSLLFSQTLSNYATECVTLAIADSRAALGEKFIPGEKPPVAVLAQADGKVLGKAENKDGFLRVDQVERLLDTEMKARRDTIKTQLDEAKNKAKAGDKQAAIDELRAVYDQRCLFPGKAKDAAKELKKLGVEVADVPAGPNFDPRVRARVEHAMRTGLEAEDREDYLHAERLYTEASRLDPGDPVPLRYLGELYRHDIGDWKKAREAFSAILAMPADPLSRAVAQHGLGKMTIHDGDFKGGLALMEASVQTYPLALAYRNLAVYWNSEGDAAKTDGYIKQALAVDPDDPYNLVFAAAFMAGNGHTEDALKVAHANESLLPASYNLAAVYAQAGQKEKALELLKRHFFEYERYQSVREKEMMEARVDAVFESLRNDPAFLA